MTKQRAVTDGLFTWPAATPQLIGSTCAACAVVTFPAQQGCPRCAADDMRETLLPTRGRLWTYTTQQFRPPSPPYAGPTQDEEAFAPYAVGYVELGDEVRVETRLTGAELGAFHIGMEMELAIVPLRSEPDGTEVLTFAFRPVSG